MSNEFEQPVEPMSRTEDLLRTGTEEPVIAMSEIEKILRGEHIDRPHSRVADLLLQYNPSDILIEKRIEENGTYYATADAADGYYKVVVDTPVVPPTVLEHLVETISTNGTHTFTPETGTDGYSDATITVDVPPEPITEDRTVENLPQPIASFNNGAEAPITSLKVAIEPQQDLHGYDSPWVGGAGKNKYSILIGADEFNDNVSATHTNNDGVLVVNATATNDSGAYSKSNSTIMGLVGQYSESITYSFDIKANISGSVLVGYTDVGRKTVDLTTNWQRVTITDTAVGTNKAFVIYNRSGSAMEIQVKNFMFEIGSVAHTYEPYSNICPISGWTEANVGVVGKNSFDLDAVTSFIKRGVVSTQGLTNQDGVITNSKSYDGDGIFPYHYPMTFSSNTITVSADIKLSGNHSSNNVFIQMFDSNGSNIVANDEVTMSSKDTWEHKTITLQLSLLTNVNLVIEARGTNNSVQIKNVQVEIGNTATAYEPYNGQTYNIQFKDGDNPLTVYGGSLDVVSGELVVDRVSVDLGSLSWMYESAYNRFYTNGVASLIKLPGDSNTPNMICSQYLCVSYSNGTLSSNNALFVGTPSGRVYAKDSRYTSASDFKTTMNGVQLVYELATPQTIQLTPTQVKSLLGSNNVWADTGDINDLDYIYVNDEVGTLINKSITANGSYCAVTDDNADGYLNIDVNVPGGGGTYTETKAVVFNNSTTTVNVGEDFLYGYGVAPSDNSYALVMSVSNGIAMAARTHNGIIDGISSNCSYSNGIFTFDAYFVTNYFGASTVSVLCLYDGGSGEAKAFTGYNQIFKESGMDIQLDPSGKFKVTWNTLSSAIGCTIQGHTNLIGNYSNINVKGNITDSCEYANKYGYDRTQFIVGVTGADWKTLVLVGYNDYNDTYKKEVITLTNQQVVNDIDINININKLAQQGYQSAYLLISLLGISGEFEVTIT